MDTTTDAPPPICEECGNDHAADGHTLCTDCLEATTTAPAVPFALTCPNCWRTTVTFGVCAACHWKGTR